MDLQEIYDKLSFTDDSLIRLSDKNWKKKVVLPSRVCRLLEENELLRTLDAFFSFDNKPLILFFKDPQDRRLYIKLSGTLMNPQSLLLLKTM